MFSHEDDINYHQVVLSFSNRTTHGVSCLCFPGDGMRTVTTFCTGQPETDIGQPPTGSLMDLTDPSQLPPWSDIVSQRVLIGTFLSSMVTKLYIFFKWHNHNLQMRVCLAWDIFAFSKIIITTTLGNINKKNWKKIQYTLTMQALRNLMYLASFYFQEENRRQWH